MKTLDELYQQMLKRAADGKPVGVDGDPKFKTEWTDPINAQEFAAGLIKHNYREGWKLVDMPR
jgi:hypothetical protein